ncbi:sorting nexin-32 isoform X1 [Mustela putorius furo]|uniref:Sorting nexin-32 isoform X1 n=1 Tax=Mustela putorius furo TaxID=9669 RepID=A0A8U0N7Z6_MUSPF|nr:sorting nexin-32 isoform X1 [Mustela putorius furo]
MEGRQEAGKESKQPSSVSVDLQGDSTLQVEISDAVSERDKVKFTVQTKSCLPHFAQTEFSVVRQHEEFIWLHDAYVENEEYAGLIIPPAPPRPDFEASREKLQKLGEGDSSITREEFAKMKQELEAEYLALFKKTVAMHEVFLQRLAAHPTLRRDHNFFVFLEYGQDLSVRGKNRKELLGGFLRNIVKSADEALITSMSGLKEVDDFFEHERTFLLEYHTRIRDACLRADRVMHSHKCLADDFIPISAALNSLGTQEVNQLKTSFLKLAELFERLRKLEGRVASDEDLKLSDMLRYYMRDSQAAKDLLYRRLRALADYENANKALDKARTRNREVRTAESHQQLCCQRFERLSDSAKQELMDFKSRRVSSFRKNLIELAELELKHAKQPLARPHDLPGQAHAPLPPKRARSCKRKLGHHGYHTWPQVRTPTSGRPGVWTSLHSWESGGQPRPTPSPIFPPPNPPTPSSFVSSLFTNKSLLFVARKPA